MKKGKNNKNIISKYMSNWNKTRFVNIYKYRMIFIIGFFIITIFMLLNKKDYDKCVMSEAYPSYGPGCKIKCSENDKYYGTVFYNSTIKWPKDLIDNMNKATNILLDYVKPYSTDINSKAWLHVAFHYYCCYSQEEAILIEDFINEYKWTSHEIQFDRIVCAISHPDKISVVLMADQESQNNLVAWAKTVEQTMEIETQIKVRIPRDKMQGFHMTLGVVPRSDSKVYEAVDKINKEIPSGTWSNNIKNLTQPICKGCKKAKRMTVNTEKNEESRV